MAAVTQFAGAALTGLARALVQQGKLRPDRAEALARQAAQSKTQFLDALLAAQDREGLDAREVARFAAQTFGHPLLDLDAIVPDALPKDLIDRKLVSSLRMLALAKRGNKITVAVSDPTNLPALDQIKFQTQLTPEIVVVEHTKLLGLTQSFTQSASQKLDDLVGADFNMDDLLVEASDELPEETGGDVDDAPVVRFLQKLLLDAINEGASDLHFEPYEKFYRVRFRVDGQLREVAQPPLAIR
ncbi:MAG: ATPase, T2SS/T4P/T4SS family, partial [Betaproteobacteria bacterium]